MGKPSVRAIEARITDKLKANIRHRYEHTDESLATMAADLGCCGETVRNMAKREGWVRYQPPPRDLSPAAQLRERVEELAEQGTAAREPPLEKGRSSAEAVGVGGRVGINADAEAIPTRLAALGDLPFLRGGEERSAGGGETSQVPAVPSNLHATLAEQILHEAAGFLDDVRAERKRMKREGYAKHELQTVSRAIADLSASLNRLKPLAQRAAEPDTGNAYDDMPADLDEFRNELARRIRAFVASRNGGGGAGGDGAPSVDQIRA